MIFCVYVLSSLKLDRYYIGYTENLQQRIVHHNNPIAAEKFTARGIPWDLYLAIECQSKKQAMKLEKLIKSNRRILGISNYIPSLFID